MPSFWKLTLLLACGGLMLAAPRPAFAVDFWVNAGGLTTAPVSGGGQMKTVSVHVGTNETTNPSLWAVYVKLDVNGSNGFQCTTQNFKEAVFHPAIAMPVRFQVVYPASTSLSGGPIGRDPKILPPVKYTVRATITKVTPTPSGDVPANNVHEYPYDLPAGGTPSCVNMPGPN